MNNPLGVSPSKGNQGTTRGKEKIFLTSLGIKPTTSGRSPEVVGLNTNGETETQPPATQAGGCGNTNANKNETRGSVIS